MAYDTACLICDKSLLNCICETGPTIPDTPTDRACTVCGHDPNTIKYKQALWRIMQCERKSDMRAIAEETLLHDHE